MLHEPAQQTGPDLASEYKTKLGLKMFLIYCLFYAGFVLTNVFTEGSAMEVILFGGLNVAVVYGMSLIVGALVLALIYNAMCTRKEKELESASSCPDKSAA